MAFDPLAMGSHGILVTPQDAAGAIVDTVLIDDSSVLSDGSK